MKPTLIFLMNSLDLKRGGLTRASMKQASFFAERNYETYMLTFNFNAKYPSIVSKLFEMGKLHKNVIVKNMFEYLEGSFESSAKKRNSYKPYSIKVLTEGLAYDKRKDCNAYRVYKNGLYYKYISLNNDNSLDFIDYFNENRYRVKRENYDTYGNLKRIKYMDFSTNKPSQNIYLNSQGHAYLTEWNNPKTGNIDRIIRFCKERGNLSVSNVFVKDNVSLKVDWLNTVINKIKNKNVIVVSDTRSTDKTLLQLNNPKAIKIWRLHSNHLAPPYNNDTKLSPNIKNVLDNLNDLDVALFLTSEQKRDIEKIYGENKKFKVIPHFHNIKYLDYLKSLLPVDFKNKNENLAVIISRFSTLKRIEDSIKAFSIVVKQLPHVKLEIWGKGDQEKSLERLITKLNLKENIFLKGYTHHPDKIYKKGLFSILTSKSEGFSLSILESMSNGTPVISYKVKYGPSDMIVNKENGFLTKDGDINQLAKKMMFMFKNPSKAKTMGKNAQAFIKRNFSEEVYKNKWEEVIDFAMKQKNKQQKD